MLPPLNRLAAATLLLLVSGPALAKTDPAAVLAACRAAAVQAADDPTQFACGWQSVVAAAAGATLTGRYDIEQKGVVGSLTVLEGREGPALIGIQTVERKGGFTCTVKVEAARGEGDELTAKPGEAPGCMIKIERSGRNRVSVKSDGCQFYCGRRIGFDGTYKLRVR